MIDKNKHQVNVANAEKMWRWINERGGIAVWRSADLANPGASWSTPALTDDNPPKPYPKPTWQAENQPSRIITDPSEVELCIDSEVKRFRVAIRSTGSFGSTLKVSDGGSRRIRDAVAKAGDGAYHEFDYDAQEAVIFKPTKVISLAEWHNQQKLEKLSAFNSSLAAFKEKK